jgi:hypothetical protein
VIFSSNIIKTPSPQELEHRKIKRKKKEKGKKALSVASNKRKVNILRGEKHFNFKNLF